MRVFTAEVKDSVSGYAMILSECSYNMAMDWLEKTLRKYGAKITHAETVMQTNGMRVTLIQTAKNGKECRKYFYDEQRGVLLGE